MNRNRNKILAHEVDTEFASLFQQELANDELIGKLPALMENAMHIKQTHKQKQGMLRVSNKSGTSPVKATAIAGQSNIKHDNFGMYRIRIHTHHLTQKPWIYLKKKKKNVEYVHINTFNVTNYSLIVKFKTKSIHIKILKCKYFCVYVTVCNSLFPSGSFTEQKIYLIYS